jgi:periplasmic divalent cation tolerance protein
MSACLVVVSVPDESTAVRLADHLLEQRLAACVTWQPGWQSKYRWQGKIEAATEVLLLCKTTLARWPELQEAVRSQHPYECPEILCFEAADGFPPYLAWLAEETKPDF